METTPFNPDFLPSDRDTRHGWDNCWIITRRSPVSVHDGGPTSPADYRDHSTQGLTDISGIPLQM